MLHKFKLFRLFSQLVFLSFLMYTLTIKGKDTHQTRKGNKMEFYSMEQMEIMGDWMDEVAEWEAYEADMETNPYD